MSSGGAPRAVIIGAGEVTTSCWLPGAALLGWNVALLDRDTQRARDVAGALDRRVQAVESLAEAGIGAGDVVVVATPPAAHGPAARDAMAAGARRLIIEKPPFASIADMDMTMAALAEHRAAARSAFIRRNWRPVAAARRLFPEWRERLGPLQRVRITEGRPYGWGSRSTSERGIDGLSSMFLDELPHPLDALFGIAGWTGAERIETSTEQLTLMDVDVSVALEADGERVDLRIRGSRTEQLPNALDLGFADGSVTVDMAPNGGILVRNGSGSPTLIACGGMPDPIEPMFADLLSAAASDPIEPFIGALETWRGPLEIAEQVGARA
jgi:predicted dehydrogenase